MNEDKVIQKIIKLEADVEDIKERMATKDDFRKMSNTMDVILTVVKKTEQEVTMITHGMRRHEDRLDAHESDIKRIKPLVGLA